MTTAECVSAIRATTRHDNDTQVTDSQLLVKVDQEFRRLRRRLSTFVPSLFQAVASIAISAGNSFAKPAGFESLILLERLGSGGRYFPVGILDPSALDANQPLRVSAYEQGSTFVVMPEAQAIGTYRLTYGTAPSAGYLSFDLPAGFEDIVIERCASWVRVRHDEDPGHHDREADRIWREQITPLRRRYGRHPVGGLAITRY